MTIWITQKEAIKETGYCRTSLYKMRKTGEVKTKKRPNGRVLFDKASLNQIFKNE